MTNLENNKDYRVVCFDVVSSATLFYNTIDYIRKKKYILWGPIIKIQITTYTVCCTLLSWSGISGLDGDHEDFRYICHTSAKTI